MKRRRIIVVNNERQDFSDRTIEWEGNAVGFTRYGFEDVVSGLRVPSAEVTIDRPKLEKMIEETRRSDAVFCESPEALLLWHVFRRRGLRAVPFVLEDEDMMRAVRLLDGWIGAVYAESALKDFVADRRNVWLHHTEAHRGFFLDAGVAADRLFHIPCEPYALTPLSPDGYLGMKRGAASGICKELRGGVVAAGVNNRDWPTFARAMEGLSARGWIVGADPRDEIGDSKNVRCKGYVSSVEYLDALASAAVVVVPMLDENMPGSENTITYSMAFSRPVVATRTRASAEVIEHGVNGLLVPARDTDALKDAIGLLLGDPALRREMGRRAKKTEEEIARRTHRAVKSAFSIAFGRRERAVE